MTVRVGLIGCGGIMRPHVEGWKAVADRAQVVAVADISPENAQTRVDQLGAPAKIYQDYRELLADDAIDAVDIALPHHLHRDAIVAAAEAGKHVMTEKPLCLNLEEAADIKRAVDASGVIMMAGHNQLFFPAVQQAKQMLLNGELGKVYMIYSVDAGARRPPLSQNKATWGQDPGSTGMNKTWRNDPAKMGGGELIDTGYHPTYRMLFLAGQKPVEVSATLGTYRLPLQREDTSNVICKFEDGAMGQVFTSWGLRAPRAKAMLFSVMGEAGQLWGEANALYYQPVGFDQPAVVEYPGFGGAMTFYAEIAHYVDAIEGGFEPLHSVDEATETLRLILGAYRSVQEGIIVKL